MKKLQIAIILEFDDIEADSDKADELIDLLTNDTKTIKAMYGAVDCWVDNAVEVL